MANDRARTRKISRHRDRTRDKEKRRTRSRGLLPEYLREQEVPEEELLEEPEAEDLDTEQEREEEDQEEPTPFLCPEGLVTTFRDLWLWTGKSLVWARSERARVRELEELRAALEDLIRKLKEHKLLGEGQNPWPLLSGALAQEWIRPLFPKRPKDKKDPQKGQKDQDTESSSEQQIFSGNLVGILEPWSLRDLTLGTSFPLGRLVQGRGEGRGRTKGGGSDLPGSAQRAWLRREARNRGLLPPLEVSTMEALRDSYEDTLNRWNEAVRGAFDRLPSPPFGMPVDKTWRYQRRKHYDTLLQEGAEPHEPASV